MAFRVPMALCMAGSGAFYSANYEFKQTKTSQEYLSRILSDTVIPCPNKLTPADRGKKVYLKGTIDNANTIIIGPKKSPHTNSNSDPNEYGSFVYSPLTLESGQTVIINRGWIPQKQMKSYYENQQSETVHYQKCSYAGIVSPKEEDISLFFEIDNKINQSNVSEENGVISAVWEFKNNCNSLKNKVQKLHKQSGYIVVDVMDCCDNSDLYPYKFTKTDIFGMFDMSPKQHLQYAYSLAMTGAMCCGLSYVAMRHPMRFKSIIGRRLFAKHA